MLGITANKNRPMTVKKNLISRYTLNTYGASIHRFYRSNWDIACHYWLSFVRLFQKDHSHATRTCEDKRTIKNIRRD